MSNECAYLECKDDEASPLHQDHQKAEDQQGKKFGCIKSRKQKKQQSKKFGCFKSRKEKKQQGKNCGCLQSRKDKRGVKDMFKEQDNWMFVPFLMSFAVLAALLAIQMQNMNGKFYLHNIKTLLPPLEGKTSLMVV